MRFLTSAHNMTAGVALLAFGIVLPVFAATWYVDPTGGTVSSDSYNGEAETWEGGGSTVGPRKTLAAALALASSGDTVIALPGVYREGVSNPTAVDTDTTLNRVRVPPGVTLKSRDGAETTIIMGAASPEPIWNGCGTNAVRCAHVEGGATKGRLIGFTLTGGHTAGYDDMTKMTGQNSGGAAVGSGICIDCIVSNNWASGTTMHGSLWGRRCRAVSHITASSLGTTSTMLVPHMVARLPIQVPIRAMGITTTPLCETWSIHSATRRIFTTASLPERSWRTRSPWTRRVS